MKVLIDNGHGVNTPGKQSPLFTFDWVEKWGVERLREYKYCREIADRVVKELTDRGIDAERIVKEDVDISLAERCRRVNAICRKEGGATKTLLISIHLNAAGNGGWRSATGFCPYIYTQGSQRSKKLAQLLYAEAERHNLKGNRAVPKEKYWTANFYILKNTNCPAVLTENLFQDSIHDVAFLMTEEGKQAITQLHVDAIIKYINEYK